MSNKTDKIQMVTIPLLEGKVVGNGDEGIVLLYDEVKKCYYRTTLSHILNVVLKKIDDIDKKLSFKYEELDTRLTDQQNAFIKDTVEVNQKIIALVQGGSEQ